MSTEGRGINSIEVGARLLEALVSTGEPMMLRDVAKLAGIAPAQAHAYLVSYRKDQLVEQDDTSGRYRLGPMALQLGIARLRSFDPFQAANEDASHLAGSSGLTVVIAVWGSYGPTVIHVHEGLGQVVINTRAGTVYSVTGTATGRVFAAFLPPDLVGKTIRAQRAEGAKGRFVGPPIDPRQIQGEIDFVRTHGYAAVTSMPLPNVNALSAPIFDIGGQLSMVATLIGTSDQLPVSPESPGVRQIVDLARKISMRAGFFEFAQPVGEVQGAKAKSRRRSSAKA